MTADETFLAAFEAQRWPLEHWHHRDHIKLAYLYLLRHPIERAGQTLGFFIRAHNAAHKIPEALDRGYHETVTQAWLRLVYLILSEYGPATDADAFVEAHPELLEKKSLRLFYSRDRIMSAEAKARFVEPDLAPLPVPRVNFDVARARP